MVTGANGFVGRHVVNSLLNRNSESSPKTSSEAKECIICLVRSNKVVNEQFYWDAVAEANTKNTNGRSTSCSIKVMPYDMLDNGNSLSQALQYAKQLSPNKICLFHVASTFGPTKDPVQTANDNVKSAVDAFDALAKIKSQGAAAPKLRLVLTSSMAAVRATNQPPLNGKYFTHLDWNTLSKLDGTNWGSCYQWSKMESEKRVLGLVLDWNDKICGGDGSAMEFVALCPSFVFGPPPPYLSSLSRNGDNNGGSTSYSVALVKQWLKGESEVQSRLCVDVRDVALAHVQAGSVNVMHFSTHTPNCYRYILSTEERLSSERVSKALKDAIRKSQNKSFDLDRIKCDTKFDGGAIRIGEKEVDSVDRLNELGVVCRCVEETMEDMARAILSDDTF